MPRNGCAVRWLAKDLMSGAYYVNEAGVFIHVGALDRSGTLVAIRFARLPKDADRWEYACEQYVFEDDAFLKGWILNPSEVPFPYGETRKRTRLMWRTVGKESHLETVPEGEERPGDLPFQWLGLTS